jgi:tRNA(Ile)-lysidine synthase
MLLTSEIFAQQLHRLNPSSPLWVAYSGGLDSHVLLYLLVRARQQYPQLNLHAIHIDHGLSPHSAAWRVHCQQVCQELGVDCHVEQLDRSKLTGPSLEASARQARYEIFTKLLSNGGTLLTAHHRDDQAETVLLRLLRGAGSQGLAAIPEQRSLGKGVLVRPLLAFTRAQLQQYAQEHQLQWIEDDSNSRTDFDRNYLRHEVVPLLQARWPAASTTLARTAEHCRETTTLLQELAAQDWQQAQGTVANTLSIAALTSLTPARQRNLLRFWLQQLDLPLPSERQLEQLRSDCLTQREDAAPLMHWSGVEVRRFNGSLYAMSPLAAHDANVILPWLDSSKPLQLPSDLGQLTVAHLEMMGIVLTNNTNVSVRFRQGGERIELPGRQGSHALKKLFQEWRVAPWLRDRIPLLYVDDKLAAVLGYAVAESFAAKTNNKEKILCK